jgi:protein gp37
MKQSAIGWTDFSGGNLNFVSGCSPVSEGCQNCYARAIYERWGKDFSKVTYSQNKLDALLKIKFPQYSPKRGAPHKPMAFVCDTGDLFHPDVPASFITDAFEVMAFRKDVTWLVLTKRPERMNEVLYGESGGWYLGGGDFIENVWLGVTAENQTSADERIPILLDTPAAVRFVSIEPMLEPINLSSVPGLNKCGQAGLDIVHNFFVICGAESGARRRQFKTEWAAKLYKQCKQAGVPFFGKQDSGLYPGTPLLIDGEIIHEWPKSSL